jgi:cobalt-zinc-cadmium efflux system outer membrane protein
MRVGFVSVAFCAVLCGVAAPARAQSRPISLAEVLARAREHAPRIVSARLALEEARARLVGASLRFQTNPELDAALGNRQAETGRSTDLEVGLTQMFEPRGRRSARSASATAAIERSTAGIAEATRVVLRDAASAFHRAVHASERIRMLGAAEDLASAVHRSSERRFKAGDIAVLDVNIARTALARVRAEREAVSGSYEQTVGDLKQLLGLHEDVTVQGSLSTTATGDLEALLQTAGQRPELQELDAAIREAEAEARLGRSFAQPELGLGVRYAREAGDQIVLGGVTVRLPAFAKGQEMRGTSSARAARLRAEAEAARARVRVEVQSAFRAYQRRLAAVRILETEALPGMDENETLTTRSFDVGQLGLPELLVIRREILDTRFQHLDALLEAALARIELDAVAGVLR